MVKTKNLQMPDSRGKIVKWDIAPEIVESEDAKGNKIKTVVSIMATNGNEVHRFSPNITDAELAIYGIEGAGSVDHMDRKIQEGKK